MGHLSIEYSSFTKFTYITRKNAIVEYLDYQIPVTQRYASSKARLKYATYRR